MHCVIIRLDADDDPERGGLGVVDLHAAGLRVHEHVHAVCLRGRPHRIEVARVVRLRGHSRQQDAAEAGGRDTLDLRDGVVDVGDRHRSRGREPREVRCEPLDDVTVVDPSVRHRQLVIVGVQPEQRQVRVHHLDVDAVEVHVVEDELRVAFGHPPAGLAIAGDRPPLEPRAVQAPKDARAALDERLDLEVLFPDRAIAQVRREAGDEQVGRLQDVPVCRDDEVLLRHCVETSRAGRQRR
jgi:hypothetical protein